MKGDPAPFLLPAVTFTRLYIIIFLSLITLKSHLLAGMVVPFVTRKQVVLLFSAVNVVENKPVRNNATKPSLFLAIDQTSNHDKKITRFAKLLFQLYRSSYKIGPAIN